MILTAQAAKDLDALPSDARRMVSYGLIGYATTGRGDVKRLRGREGFRMYIGQYRVIFDEDKITVLAVIPAADRGGPTRDENDATAPDYPFSQRR